MLEIRSAEKSRKTVLFYIFRIHISFQFKSLHLCLPVTDGIRKLKRVVSEIKLKFQRI